MKVFKFGGASVQNADAVRNMSQIIGSYIADSTDLLVVVSAMGKTTNALERLIKAYRNQEKELYELELKQLKEYHYQITSELFEDKNAPIFTILDKTFFALENAVKTWDDIFDKHYDQVISMGEVISTHIVAEYLNNLYGNCLWIDARKFIQTNDMWREGVIEWSWTELLIKNQLRPLIKGKFVVTQGFIGSTIGGKTTTLGREGSDFSAAIFAYCLEAESVTIWKDVAGILNADPKRISNTRLFDRLSYEDAAEMTYYGATVIHPKTIKPLANKNIPLYVKSFIAPQNAGTVIGKFDIKSNVPAIIFKTNQCLLTFSPRNLDSINQTNLALIFSEMNHFNLKINLMQSSAISFSVCTNADMEKINELRKIFEKEFQLVIQDKLELLTIKNYDEETRIHFSNLGNAVIEQRTKSDYQIVLSK